MHWGEVIETNHVGTQELVRFCRLVGAEPYLCGNVGSGTARELRDWVEYCNFPGDSSWAAQRAADGSAEPLDVAYWGVGNESWGCGGWFSPEDYCTEFRRYASFIRGFGGKKAFVIACGAPGGQDNDTDWTSRFFAKLTKSYWPFGNIHGFAAHYYCGTAGSATEYSTDQWYELIARGLRMEPLVIRQRAAMDVYDPGRRIGLIVDEWGTWHPVEKGTNPAFLYQQNTVRDAVVAAATLDIFNRHADKVVMANIAQTVNVLQAVVLTQGDRIVVTPTGHVYEMYAPHQGGQSVRVQLDTDQVGFTLEGRSEVLPVVAGSASLKGKTLFVTLTNAHAADAAEVTMSLVGGARAEAASARAISGEIHLHNTFDSPERVRPVEQPAAARGSEWKVTLPAASVAAIEVRLS